MTVPRATAPPTAPDIAPAAAPAAHRPYDPLRLCVYATVALLGWLLGPWAVAGFAGLGLAGYVKARRAGLARSDCLLRDTRLVIGYLGVVALVALGFAVHMVVRLFG